MTFQEWQASKKFSNENEFFNEEDKVPQFVYADGAFIIIDTNGIFGVYIEAKEKSFDKLSDAEAYLWQHHSSSNYNV